MISVSKERFFESLRALMERVAKEHPIVGDFEDDARNNWPERWFVLWELAVASPLPDEPVDGRPLCVICDKPIHYRTDHYFTPIQPKKRKFYTCNNEPGIGHWEDQLVDGNCPVCGGPVVPVEDACRPS